MGKDGSTWKHGYIPENAAAMALKAHRKPGGGGKTSAKPKMTRRQAAVRGQADELARMHKAAQKQSNLTTKAKASLNRISGTTKKSTRKK